MVLLGPCGPWDYSGYPVGSAQKLLGVYVVMLWVHVVLGVMAPNTFHPGKEGLEQGLLH